MAVGWSLVANVIPLYSLYALLFADSGLSGGEITALFALWSAVGIVTEIPAGAVADRFSRRGALVAAGLLEAAGFALWITVPRFAGFALGFVLWGLGGALVSGAFEALLYDGLAVLGATSLYSSVLGRVSAAGQVAQLPAAGLATVLFAVGGYRLAGWVSVGFCLATAALAARLPEPPREWAAGNDEEEAADNFVAVFIAGLREAARHPAVRGAVVAVALLTGFDAIDEYFPLMAHGWGVATAAVPLAILGIPLAGAAFAAGGGAASRLQPWVLALVAGGAAMALGSASLLHQPSGLAVVALFYGLYRLSLVAVEARLQHAITGRARATVTSVAAVGTAVATFGLYGAWVLGGPILTAVLLAVLAVLLPILLRRRDQRASRTDDQSPVSSTARGSST